jgi:ubiquinone/menaquinone biosynthesis C-methylase UbiE
MIRLDGWHRFNIWEHSAAVRALYEQRARREAEEMTCAAQAAELLRPLVSKGDTLLDIGCGSGYFFHSLARRGIPAEYHGLDASPSLIALGQSILPGHGLPKERLLVGRIEDLNAQVDHIVCMNVLSNIDNFHRPLERMLRSARKSVVLRESIRDAAEERYVIDKYLEADEPLRVHVNTYARADIAALAHELGFDAQFIADERARGQAELVIDYPHYWTFVLMRPRGPAA